jgi:hypothetical protein
MEEDGGENLYGFVGNSAIVNYDLLGRSYKFHGVKRVKSISAGRTMGFLDAKCALITRCLCDHEDKKWKAYKIAFWVHTEVYVRTHIAASSSGKPLVHIPRPESFIGGTITHEMIHEKIVKQWHDKAEPQVDIDFNPASHSYGSESDCEAYRKERVKHWRDEWWSLRRNPHDYDEFKNGNAPIIGSGVERKDAPDGYAIDADDSDGETGFWKWAFDGR